MKSTTKQILRRAANALDVALDRGYITRERLEEISDDFQNLATVLSADADNAREHDHDDAREMEKDAVALELIADVFIDVLFERGK